MLNLSNSSFKSIMNIISYVTKLTFFISNIIKKII